MRQAGLGREGNGLRSLNSRGLGQSHGALDIGWPCRVVLRQRLAFLPHLLVGWNLLQGGVSPQVRQVSGGPQL